MPPQATRRPEKINKDAIQILKDHGFNYIRLRIFNDPAA
jgi:arabinogalactan endo-1,4-beta-galactosidase